jgi:FtsP/CotA-like multicopper oxidase with cupredoxin domain
MISSSYFIIALFLSLLIGSNTVLAEVKEYTLVVNGAYIVKTDENGEPISREGSLVNGSLPGPIIEAPEGDTLMITVINEQDQSSDEASLHWHGMFQVSGSKK